MASKNIYLPNLDGIRALAVLFVIVSHVELHKETFGLATSVTYEQHKMLGGTGVTIFFVLSGFLITYLLFEEKNTSGQVVIRNFYLRRMLRIWPLFFLVLLVGFSISSGWSWSAVALSIFFLTNGAFVAGMLPAIIDPIWSIGVEEQFYLFQPHLVKSGQTRRVAINFLVVIFLFYLIKYVCTRLLFPVGSTHYTLVTSLFYFTRFDCMMIGGLGACAFYEFRQLPERATFLSTSFFRPWVKYLFPLLLLAYLVLYISEKVPFNHQLLALLFLPVVLNLANDPKGNGLLESWPFKEVGKVSYGLYLLHKFPLYLVLWAFTNWQIEWGIWNNLTIYAFTLLLSLLLARVSFYYFEKPFLKLKSRFATLTRPD
ncbi:acyltransferase [Rhabdobacter roseus]|uniref:Peptidoglycan/LPS O-acetylase OafA/YrhL n=1 Tax=Rhabdobacter roseus TaxID=1655419 RepID=A0A840U673_9BACT|nr:acyltransferase [Rhabdobacter roseus]MBB5287319.1 peptidoglycan/LPS O-acetylase OafA/YrhL [Rhabdobacter roseus]